MSAPILQISLSQAPVFVLNSRLGLSCATGLRSGSKFLHALRLSLSLSYGYNLPSSLTRVVPRTLGFSPRPPVSVSVRVVCLYLEAFLGSVESISSSLFLVTPHHASAFEMVDLPATSPTRLNTNFHPRADLSYCVTPSIKQFILVQEFQPVVHRLRFSASA